MFNSNILAMNAISTYGVADTCGMLFNLSPEQEQDAYRVSLALYAVLKNQESTLLAQLANIDLSAKSPQEVTVELSYYKGSIAQVRMLLTSIEQVYSAPSEQEN